MKEDTTQFLLNIIGQGNRPNWGDPIQVNTILRALRLLAAAEGGEGTPETDIATMVTLCRLAPNEAADAIESGDHNDSDIEAVIHWVRHFPDAATLIEALHSERNGLVARVRELERMIEDARNDMDAMRKRHADEMARFGCPFVNSVVSREDGYSIAHAIIDAYPTPDGLRVVIASVARSQP